MRNNKSFKSIHTKSSEQMKTPRKSSAQISFSKQETVLCYKAYKKKKKKNGEKIYL